MIETSPAPFPHWTIKEIMEQPIAASRALGYGGRLHPEVTEIPTISTQDSERQASEVMSAGWDQTWRS